MCERVDWQATINNLHAPLVTTFSLSNKWHEWDPNVMMIIGLWSCVDCCLVDDIGDACVT